MRWEEKEGKIDLAEGLSQLESSQMCDYSLHSIKSRPAKVGDKLTTRDFGTGTRGFAASEDMNVAVCVLPGTELAFAHDVQRLSVHGEWFVVPDAAVVTEPNRFGPAVVWPYNDRYGNTQIRCFMPGAGT